MDAKQLLSMSPSEVWRQYRNDLTEVYQTLCDYLDVAGWNGEEFWQVHSMSQALYDFAIDAKRIR